MKVQVSTVVVRHARSGDKAFSPSKSRGSRGTPHLEADDELICSWGGGMVDPPSTSNGHAPEEGLAHPGDAPSAGSAAQVRRSLLEYLARSAQTRDGLVEGPASPVTASPPQREGAEQASPPGSTPAPSSRASMSSPSVRAVVTEALQYRLLKHKGRSGKGWGDGSQATTSVLTSTSHGISLAPIRVHLTEGLLKRLLTFAGAGDGHRSCNTQRHEGGSGVLPLVMAAGASAGAGAADSPPPAQSEDRRSRRFSSSLKGKKSGSAPSSPRRVSEPLPVVRSQTSLHLAVRSLDVTLELEARLGSLEEPTDAPGTRPPPLGSTTLLALLVDEAELKGSESSSWPASATSLGREQQRGGGTSRARQAPSRPHRVCSLSLDTLSVVLLPPSCGTGSLLPRGEASMRSRRLSVPWQRVLDDLRSSASSTVPATRRLMDVRGLCVTAEMLTKAPDAAARTSGAVTQAAHPLKALAGQWDVTFSASCEALQLCASDGAALLAMELYVLAEKMQRMQGMQGVQGGASWDSGGSPVSQGRAWSRRPDGKPHSVWLQGLSVSLARMSVGGSLDSTGGKMRGNTQRLVVWVVRGPWRSVEAAVFEGASDSNRGVVWWSLETIEGGSVTDLLLSGEVQPAVLHFLEMQKAYQELKSFLKTCETAFASARWRLEGSLASPGGLGASEGVAGPAANGGRVGTVHFDVRGSNILMHLPFDLSLKVKRASVVSRRMARSSVVGEHTNGQSRSNAGDLVMDLGAEDIQVMHGWRRVESSPADLRPPAVRCNAKGFVSLKPSIDATAVSLQSEHVRGILTPAFCASFGGFVRFMVGPPPNPQAAPPRATVIHRRNPPTFSFELGVRQADVDFETGPCSPWGISTKVVVDGLLMKQQTTSQRSPGAGSHSAFSMSLEAIQGTQTRHPLRSAPALPERAVSLILGYAQGHAARDTPGTGVFVRWVARRKRRPMRADGGLGGTVLSQPFLMALDEVGNTRAAKGHAFSVLATTSGPRQRVVTGLTLKGSPMLLVWYPPTVRLMMEHYNRFSAQAFRSFRCRAHLPRKKIAVSLYDVDIRGCSVILLASLAVGARGIHVSAGHVRMKEDDTTNAPVPGPLGMARASSLPPDSRAAAEFPVAMSGFVGPVEATFVQDWRRLLPAPYAAAVSKGVGTCAQLCEPIDVRWTISYDEDDRYRQDVSLSSIQLYLEHSHFDLCARLVQIFVAADFAGSLPPTSRPTTPPTATPSMATPPTATPPTAVPRPSNGEVLRTPPRRAVSPGLAQRVERTPQGLRRSLSEEAAGVAAGAGQGAVRAGGGSPGAFNPVLDLSLRLPLLQVVLSMGKRDGPSPPVLEVDVASVRLARGGVLSVRHLSINSWAQQASRSPDGSRLEPGRLDGEGDRVCRVLERRGQSEESAKDFLRVEAQAPPRGLAGDPPLDLVIQARHAGKRCSGAAVFLCT